MAKGTESYRTLLVGYDSGLTSSCPPNSPIVGSLPMVTAELQWNKHITWNLTDSGLPLFTNSVKLASLNLFSH